MLLSLHNIIFHSLMYSKRKNFKKTFMKYPNDSALTQRFVYESDAE